MLDRPRGSDSEPLTGRELTRTLRDLDIDDVVGVVASAGATNTGAIDPHKWLFTPIDCAAVLYREPRTALEAHRQYADYLTAANGPSADNPSDYSVHLTRRARGLPLWASLIANGAEAYAGAVEQCLTLAQIAARRIEMSPVLELAAPPQLSVVLFRRHGWTAADYAEWSDRARLTGLALVTPTRHAGETVLRLCFVNPHTTDADIDKVLCCLESSGHQP